jgi:adenine-specific DNA-methyltransferase
MAKRKNSGTTSRVKTADYRHTREKRTNIPPAKIAAEGAVPKVPKARYYYSPHLPPVLRFDPAGSADRLPELIVESGKRSLKPEEQRLLADALRQQQPWLEWATKREQHEKGFLEVDPVAVHIHERVSAQAIVHAAMREEVQRSLFADPELPYQQAVQFYRHDMDWANRLILGDSLQVMSSLARRESLAGKVQMIYIDPPYGIDFRSNFQPELGKRDIKDKDGDLTRELETVRAYRDTWRLGVHSYLSYLRDRLIVAKELLTDAGSIFIQINDENLHVVRNLLDEVFGASNCVVTLLIKKKGSQKGSMIDPVNDYVLWYTKSIAAAREQFQSYYESAVVDAEYLETFRLVELPSGEVVSVSQLGASGRPPVDYSADSSRLFQDFPGARLFTSENATAGGVRTNQSVTFEFEGQVFDPGIKRGSCWKHTAVAVSGSLSGMERMARSGRLYVGEKQLRFRRYAGDFGARELSNWWDGLGGASNPVYVVQTNTEIVKRLILMTTKPGDLVLDPTCGSGTTAYVAEQWGRRWITIDTSRVAIAIARHRLLTAQYPYYRLNDAGVGLRAGLRCKRVAHVTSSVVANCQHLDPIFARHELLLEEKLNAANAALGGVSEAVRNSLAGKLAAKEREDGRRAVTDADRQRWVLPRKGSKWEHWAVPFDTDPDWPQELQYAVSAYRGAWRAKMDEVNACIAANVDHAELVDQPEVVKGIARVSGPFTVEGVRPAELGLDEQGLFGGAPEIVVRADRDLLVDQQNVNAYLTQMVQHLRADGVTFLGNKHRRFGRVEPLFEMATGSIVHAEGLWEGQDPSAPNTVAVGFGPQYGPVTAEQVEELVRASKRYDELVIAGFSFDAAAAAAIQEASHPKLRIHQAYVRPDINPGMDGLLKVTGQSQLFTVFGQPEIKVQSADDGHLTVKLEGVDVYDPIENAVRCTGAEKVAAWFLDSDYDGRCFCISQAFFPRQDAWEKISKALGGNADADAFAAFGGTTSLPFRPGKHRRIAVKVIDPRGNEVMTVRALKS